MYSPCLERVRIGLLVVLGCVASSLAHAGDPAPGTLRVCAHPDNLPFSAEDKSGFDNRIARVLADAMHVRVEFTWFEPQHGLVRKTLGAGLCDAIFGLPEGYEGVALTRPYYRSRYVFVYPHGTAAPRSFADPALKRERIGVQLIGDDMAATPPGYALARAGAQVIGFPVYGEGPAVARMVDALARGDLDLAVAWGPAAGYFAGRSDRALDIAPAAAPSNLASMPFEFAIGIGVRKEDQALKAALDRALQSRKSEIDAILRDFDVPRSDTATITSALPCAAPSC